MNGKIVFETPWFSVEETDVCMVPGDDPVSRFYKINHPPGVVALPITRNGDFILIRQLRPAMGKMTIEFPAGGIDADETAAEAMARELTEETGYVSGNIKKVGSGVLRIDREDTLNTYFVALDAEPKTGRTPEAGVEVLVVSPGEFVNLLRNNQFDHIAALPIFVMAECRFGLKLLPH